MRIYNLLHELVNKFAPMDEIQGAQMLNDATNYYAQLREKAKMVREENQFAEHHNKTESDKPDFKPMPLKPILVQYKVIEALEHVFARYIMAILFIILVPAIQKFMNGVGHEEEDPTEIRKRELMQELFNLRR